MQCHDARAEGLIFGQETSIGETMQNVGFEMDGAFSRRNFLKGAAAGLAVGSAAVIAGCAPERSRVAKMNRWLIPHRQMIFRRSAR